MKKKGSVKKTNNTILKASKTSREVIKTSPRQETFFASLTRRQVQFLIGAIVLLVFLINIGIILFFQSQHQKEAVKAASSQEIYWFLLHRKSQKEYFYRGVPGDPLESKLIKTFTVKTGIPGERPTPLPQKVGREYWLIVSEHEQFENPETAPYFLTLNIPVGEEEPFGPTPYTECGGQQCNWILPGAFGLHGTASDSSKLASENPGSSGCIRHRDEDIAYLYNLLDPKKEEIRYYIEDI